MRLDQLRTLMEMTTDDAANVFKKLGFDPEGKTQDEIKKAYRKLSMAHHHDKGGSLEISQMLNAAYDVLRNKPRVDPKQNRTRYRSSRGWRRQAQPEEGDTSWAQAGWSGGMRNSSSIYRRDYTDVNFIKKTMWEKSGKSTVEWTIWGFDGHYFRGVVTVYGNAKVFPDMAEAMITWQTKGANPYPCRAVFVQLRNDKELHLIWSDGIPYFNDPIRFTHDSFNRNPGNDQEFTRGLPALLDKLKARHMMKDIRGSKEDHRV